MLAERERAPDPFGLGALVVRVGHGVVARVLPVSLDAVLLGIDVLGVLLLHLGDGEFHFRFGVFDFRFGIGRGAIAEFHEERDEAEEGQPARLHFFGPSVARIKKS